MRGSDGQDITSAVQAVAALSREVSDIECLFSRVREMAAELCACEVWVGWASEAADVVPAGWTEVRSPAPASVCARARGAGREGVLAPVLAAVALAADAVGLRAELAEARSRADGAEVFWHELVDTMPIAVAVRRGPAQQIVHVNRAGREMLRRDLRPGAGRDLPEVAESGLYRHYDEVLRSGEVRRVPNFRAMVGSPPVEVLADLTIMPVRGPDGVVDGTALFAVDTTAASARAREAEATEQRLSQLLRSVRAIVWEYSVPDGTITYVNEGAPDVLGYPPEAWRRPGFWRSIVVEEDAGEVFGDPERRAGEYELEYRVRAADGRILWLHDSVQSAAGPDGNVIVQRGVALDITSRKDVESARERMQTEMLEFQKLEGLGVMAGGIAHDFNNLLTVILGNASLASMRLPPHSPARSAIEDLIANAHRAADLTRQLLAYSGRAQLTTEVLDLSLMVREIRGLIGAAMPKSATLDVDLNPLVPAVEGDRAQLQQVIVNLVNNAAESLGDRPGRVWVQNAYVALDNDHAGALKLPPGAYVMLEVRDDGCGMPESVRRRIFDPFFTTKEHGRGLGLAAVHGIVRGHRGAIEVRSREEAGTTVRVFLPASVVRPVPRSEPRGELRNGTGLILVIDDEAEVRATARAMLEALGYDVVEADDGRTGLLAYDRQASEIDAVLLDMTMPIMSGEEVFRALKSRDPGVKIVLSTGYSQVDARRRGILDGCAAFLQKPYTVRQLSEAMARALLPADAS